MRFFHVIASALLLVSFLGCSAKAPPEPIWIAQLLPPENAHRDRARHARQGVEMAVEESRASGEVVAGRTRAVLHVESRDDPAAVAAETIRVLTVNKAVGLLTDFEFARTERTIRESRSYGVPVIVPGELPGAADSEAVVSLGALPSVRGRLLARYASTELHVTRAVVLTDSRRPLAAALAAAFVKAWPRERGGIEEWTFTTADERDKGASRLPGATPAVVVLACSLEDFRTLLPRITAALPKVPLLYGGEDVGSAPLLAPLEARPETYLATVYSADHLSEAGKTFAQHYAERFHEQPELHAAQSYDACRLLFEAMHRAGSAKKEAIVHELGQIETFESVTGPVRWKERQPRRRVFLFKLKSDAAHVVSIVEPDEN